MTRTLCWLAAFPHQAYRLLETPSDRNAVRFRGIAVVLSPAAFGMALYTSGSQLVEGKPYFGLLVVGVFVLDSLLVSLCWNHQRVSLGMLRVLRLGVMMVSIAIASIAAVSSESESLLQRMHDKEDGATLASAAAIDIMNRKEAVRTRIAVNDEILFDKPAIEADALESRRLQAFECSGIKHVDARTGIEIVGGKCGPRAAQHKAMAEMLEARLQQLSRIEAESVALEQEYQGLTQELESLLRSSRSPVSTSTLFRSLFEEISLAIWFVVAGTAICIVLIEGLAMGLAASPVSPALQAAVQTSREIDQARLSLWRDEEFAELHKERERKRESQAAALRPLDIQLLPNTQELAANEEQDIEEENEDARQPA